MANLGPFCEALGLTETALTNQDIPNVGHISNGVALELKNFCETKQWTNQMYIDVLSKLDDNLKGINVKRHGSL